MIDGEVSELAVNNDVLVKINSLKKYFPVRSGIFLRAKKYVRAVDNVSFTIKKNETLALVGESGCGKTTIGRTILHLLEPTDGEVIFDNKNLTKIDVYDIIKCCKDGKLTI